MRPGLPALIPPSKYGQEHLDEIVAEGFDCHIEQMSDYGYILIFSKGDEEHRFWMGSKSGRGAVAMYQVE